MRACLFAVAMAAPIAAGAHTIPRDDAADYCEWTTAVSDSQSDLLLAPQLFLNVGIANPADSLAAGASSLPTTAFRLSAGLQYSFVALYRGIATRQWATAECSRYTDVSKLRALLVNDEEHEPLAALLAQGSVLDAALPHAEEILRATQQAFAESRVTVGDLNAVTLNVEALRAQLEQNHVLRQSPVDVPLPTEPIARILKERDAHEEAVERIEAHLRQAAAWDVGFKIGYDEVFGANNSLPLFAVGTLAVNLGGLAQFSADARARAARRRWVRDQVEGVDQRVSQTLKRLRVVLANERRRLLEVDVLVADIAQRLATIEPLAEKIDRLKRNRDALWFDVVKARAEQAYLKAHVEELARVLREE